MSYPHTTVNDYASAQAWLAKGRNPTRRKVAHNTYVVATDVDGCIGIQYHATIVVAYHHDGRVTLNTGGWRTVTTAARIRWFAPKVTVRSDRDRGWCLWLADDERTPSKVRACRRCKGAGGSWYESWWNYDGTAHRRLETPERHWAECYGCDGHGERDYGNRPIPRAFMDGQTVDADGRYWGTIPVPRPMVDYQPRTRSRGYWNSRYGGADDYASTPSYALRMARVASNPLPQYVAPTPGPCDGPDTYDASQRWSLVGAEADAAIDDWNDFIAGLKTTNRNLGGSNR